MTENVQRHEMTTKRIVYRLPGMESVPVRRDVVYRTTNGERLTLDVYTPKDAMAGARLPAVVFVIGYSDVGAVQRLGCRFKDMASYVDWAQLAAASGMIGILYANTEPAADVRAVLEYIENNAAALGIDEKRIGVWASSGNVPVALATLLRDRGRTPRCAALCYGLMLDTNDTHFVAEASKAFGFMNPCGGRSVDDLVHDVPLFIARAGKDEFAHLNDTIDAFVARALALNLPVTLMNHPDGPHAFDINQDSATTRAIIRQILAFLRCHLLAEQM